MYKLSKYVFLLPHLTRYSSEIYPHINMLFVKHRMITYLLQTLQIPFRPLVSPAAFKSLWKDQLHFRILHEFQYLWVDPLSLFTPANFILLLTDSCSSVFDTVCSNLCIFQLLHWDILQRRSMSCNGLCCPRLCRFIIRYGCLIIMNDARKSIIQS